MVTPPQGWSQRAEKTHDHRQTSNTRVFCTQQGTIRATEANRRENEGSRKQGRGQASFPDGNSWFIVMEAECVLVSPVLRGEGLVGVQGQRERFS